MTRWEYMHSTVTEPDNEDQVMNNLGAAGWELVAIRPSHGGERRRFYFKRPMPVSGTPTEEKRGR